VLYARQSERQTPEMRYNMGVLLNESGDAEAAANAAQALQGIEGIQQ
jgi:hypothetical protein